MPEADQEIVIGRGALVIEGVDLIYDGVGMHIRPRQLLLNWATRSDRQGGGVT